MSYWHNDTSDANARTQGKRMISQYQAGAAAMAASGTKPTYFHSEADVQTFYPSLAATSPAVRRVRPGGENVLRTAAMNDHMAHQAAVNREHQQSQQLALWHSRHEATAQQGERRRGDLTLTADIKVANAELKVLRRARLKSLLEAEHQQHKRELAAKGLAILYDEP